MSILVNPLYILKTSIRSRLLLLSSNVHKLSVSVCHNDFYPKTELVRLCYIDYDSRIQCGVRSGRSGVVTTARRRVVTRSYDVLETRRRILAPVTCVTSHVTWRDNTRHQ